MDRRMELAILVLALVGLFASQSTLVLIPPLTVGVLGTIVFVLGMAGIFSDGFNGFFDAAAQ